LHTVLHFGPTKGWKLYSVCAFIGAFAYSAARWAKKGWKLYSVCACIAVFAYGTALWTKKAWKLCGVCAFIQTGRWRRSFVFSPSLPPPGGVDRKANIIIIQKQTNKTITNRKLKPKTNIKKNKTWGSNGKK